MTKILFLPTLLFLAAASQSLASSKLDEIALRKAARRGDQSEITALLQNSVDPDAADENGWTALHYACKNDQVASARLLIERGAKIDGIEDHVATPLSLALEKRNEELVSLLLAHGADLNRDLPVDAIVEHRRIDLLELLIEHGINVHRVDKKEKHYFIPQ